MTARPFIYLRAIVKVIRKHCANFMTVQKMWNLCNWRKIGQKAPVQRRSGAILAPSLVPLRPINQGSCRR